MWARLLVLLVLTTPATGQDTRYPCPSSSCWCQEGVPSSAVTVTSKVPFHTALNHLTGKNQTLFLDEYIPPPPVKGLRPAVVVIHGGAFNTGPYDGCSHGRDWETFVEMAQTFARRGFVAVSIDYRCERPLSKTDPQDVLRDPVEDARAAVNYLQASAARLQLDPQRITAFGGSAGAATVANMIYMNLSSQEVGTNLTCGIALSGDLLKPVTAAGNVFANAQSAPYIDFHGTKDSTVPYDDSTPKGKTNGNALDTKKWLDTQHADNGLVAIPGAGHVPFQFLYEAPYNVTLFGFLLDKMGLESLHCPALAGSRPQSQRYI